MKRVMAMILLGTICSLIVTAQENQAANTQIKAQTQTEFDQVLLKKGTLIVKEFFTFGSFGKIKGEIAVLTDVNNNSKLYALRLTAPYYNSQYDNGDAIASFDAKEIESAISSIEFMKKKYSELNDTSPYTEIIYKGNGEPQIGFYASGKDKNFFFKINYQKTIYFDYNQLESLNKFFMDAKAKITELGGTFK